jgi:hypothetical protein
MYSSYHNNDPLFRRSTLNSSTAWITLNSNAASWMVVDVGRLVRLLGVAIQARGDAPEQRVTSLRVAARTVTYEPWRVADNGADFIVEPSGDAVAMVRLAFPMPAARFVKITPRTWEGSNRAAMRCGLLVSGALPSSSLVSPRLLLTPSFSTEHEATTLAFPRCTPDDHATQRTVGARCVLNREHAARLENIVLPPMSETCSAIWSAFPYTYFDYSLVPG